MSEKKRQKKDGEDKNKKNQRMREANDKSEKKNTAPRAEHKVTTVHRAD
jgi:hypothetical protein